MTNPYKEIFDDLDDGKLSHKSDERYFDREIKRPPPEYQIKTLVSLEDEAGMDDDILKEGDSSVSEKEKSSVYRGGKDEDKLSDAAILENVFKHFVGSSFETEPTSSLTPDEQKTLPFKPTPISATDTAPSQRDKDLFDAVYVNNDYGQWQWDETDWDIEMMLNHPFLLIDSQEIIYPEEKTGSIRFNNLPKGIDSRRFDVGKVRGWYIVSAIILSILIYWLLNY